MLDTGDDAIEIAREHGVLYRKGSGSDDESLERVGIARARGLLASADSDAENLYITLSARSQRPDLMIVARASSREAERKLMLAGANRVVQPYASAGTEMAKLALKPQVAAFLELVSSHAGPGPAVRGARRHRRLPAGGEDDSRASDPEHDRRRRDRPRQDRRDLRRDPEPGRHDRCRATC